MLADWLAELTVIIDRTSAIGRGLNTARKGIKTADEACNVMRTEALAMVGKLEDLLTQEAGRASRKDLKHALPSRGRDLTVTG